LNCLLSHDVLVSVPDVLALGRFVMAVHSGCTVTTSTECSQRANGGNGLEQHAKSAGGGRGGW
jgi:hypothetical protein